MNSFLVRPTEIYKDSYIESVREFQPDGRHTALEIKHLKQDFGAHVRELLKRETEPLPGRVNETMYWLVDEQGYIGRVSIRHELNERLRKIGGHIGYEIRPSRRLEGQGKRILALALLEAPKLGLSRVMITCDSTNIGSRKIIEANGGQFAGQFDLPGRDVPIRHYWIDTSG